MHAAIRTKVPLKKKVRGERSKTKRSVANAAASAAATVVTATAKTADGNALKTMDKSAVPGAISSKCNSKSKTLKHSIARQTKKIKQSRKTPHGVQHIESQRKLTKNPLASTMAKVKSSRTKSKLSSPSKANDLVVKQTKRASVDDDKLNAFGKVQQWLLESPTTTTTTTVAAAAAAATQAAISSTTNAAAALQELDQIDNNKTNRPMCKSQSQTHNLTNTAQRNPPPKKVKSLSNLQEKVKLQFVYKPPFKLSLKLTSNSAVQTRAVPNSGEATRNRRAARVDKNRKLTDLVDRKKQRTALLITAQTKKGRDIDSSDHGFRLVKSSNHRRTNEDRQQLINWPTCDRKQDTLELKAERSAILAPDEKVGNHMTVGGPSHLIEPSTAINTDTFKISKTSSGTKLLSNSINALNEIDNPPSLCIGNEYVKSNVNRGSFINNFRHSIAAATDQTSYYTPYGGRSGQTSTSNLLKDLHKITRSSTTNLSKNHSHRNSFDAKHTVHNVARSNSTNNFSRDRNMFNNDAHLNLIKQSAHMPRHSSKASTAVDKLSNSENGTLPSSAISSTSSTNTNASGNSAKMKETP